MEECEMNHKVKGRVQFYEKIFTQLNAIIFVFDLNKNKLLWANDSFKNILGYKKSARSIPEEEMLDVYHPDDRGILEDMRNFFRTNKSGTFTGLFKFRDASMNYLWLCSVANVFRNSADGSIFEIVVVSIDFTNQLTYNKNIKLLSREKTREANMDIINRITRREVEILKYFANGYKAREISELLGLSFHTVNNHRKNMLKKLGLKNLAALVNFAVENGLS